MLQRVYSREDDEFLTPVARQLWQVLRPGLKFSQENEMTSVWENIYEVSRHEFVVW
jgi:hypothetical protein